MKVKKTVLLDSKTLLKAIRGIPGLQKTEKAVIRNKFGSIQTDWTIEATWTDDEVIDGVYEKDKVA